MNTPLRAILSSVAVVGALAASTATASAAIVINEVESNDVAIADFVELTNTGAAQVDISGYVIKDNDNANAWTIPAGTMLDPNGHYVANVDTGPAAFGLGKDDSARLYAPADLLNPIDSYSWTQHAGHTYGRCPDGTGPIGLTLSPTPSMANDCTMPTTAWPGSPTVATADGVNVFSRNLSGLAYQPATTGSPAVLWAVRNSPSRLYRLLYDGAKWAPDTANGWAGGKDLVYPNGTGAPDAEGVTLASDANAIYVSVERNDSGPAGDISRPAILRYDVSAPGAVLTATHEWNLTPDLPGLDKNAGLEALTWIPDDVLVSKGLLDGFMATPYDPASYPDHGKGVFFAGVEQDGRILAYTLNHKTGTYTRIATISSGLPKVMELNYEPESNKLWAVCDNDCLGRTTTLDVKAGFFNVLKSYDRPAGMPNINNEGFAIAPQSECKNGLKPVFYSDDDNTDSHALRTGMINCTPLPQQPASPQTPAPQTTTPMDPPTPTCCGPNAAPQLKVALKITKQRKFRVALTLSERADVTITVKSKSRTVAKSTRKGVAKGQRSFTLTAKKAIRKGQKVTLTVQARDADGAITTRRVTAKVR
jgi:Lamin Tail Domain/Esterase-like activity of phytase